MKIVKIKDERDSSEDTERNSLSVHQKDQEGTVGPKGDFQ